MRWFTETFVGKILETRWYVWVIVAVLLSFGVWMVWAGKRKRWNGQRIAYAAMCIAVAFTLSCFRLFRMPGGGSVTPMSMLPVILFALAFGPAQGAMVGCAYGLLQLLQDPSGVIHPVQMLLDYPLAFAALGLGGLAAKFPAESLRLPFAALIAALGRYVMAVLSGAVFFASYAPEGQSSLLFSLVYNITYLGPDVLLCVVGACIPGIGRLPSLLSRKRF